MLTIFEREFYIEWISLIENHSIEERKILKGFTDSVLENKYKLALLKSEDELLQI